jgi:hypothetical protein
MRVYAEENVRRGQVIRNHLAFIGELSPFLEIGSNVGHTSYMLANQFGAEGFALDLSADSLRYGVALQDAWGLSRAPVRVAGDAANLPFADGSLRMVCAFQMLSQFMNIESEKFSKSRNWAVWLPDILTLYDPDRAQAVSHKGRISGWAFPACIEYVTTCPGWSVPLRTAAVVPGSKVML